MLPIFKSLQRLTISRWWKVRILTLTPRALQDLVFQTLASSLLSSPTTFPIAPFARNTLVFPFPDYCKHTSPPGPLHFLLSIAPHSCIIWSYTSFKSAQMSPAQRGLFSTTPHNSSPFLPPWLFSFPLLGFIQFHNSEKVENTYHNTYLCVLPV